MPGADGEVEHGVAAGGARVDVRPVVEQVAHYGDLAIGGGDREGSAQVRLPLLAQGRVRLEHLADMRQVAHFGEGMDAPRLRDSGAGCGGMEGGAGEGGEK